METHGYKIHDIYQRNYPRSDSENSIVKVHMKRDSWKIVTERTNTDFFSSLGLIGGFSTIITFIFRLLTSFVSEKLYHGALIRKLYHLKKIPEISYMKLRKTANGSK